MSSFPEIVVAPNLPNFTITSAAPSVGSRAWMAEVMQETLNPTAEELLESIWNLLEDAVNGTLDGAIDLMILALRELRRLVDGASDEQVNKELDALREAGQKEYARAEEDAFANFKRAATRVGGDLVSPQIALGIYLSKHLDGIQSHFEGHVSQREPVQGRINDAIVYLCLLRGMHRADV